MWLVLLIMYTFQLTVIWQNQCPIREAIVNSPRTTFTKCVHPDPSTSRCQGWSSRM